MLTGLSTPDTLLRALSLLVFKPPKPTARCKSSSIQTMMDRQTAVAQQSSFILQCAARLTDLHDSQSHIAETRDACRADKSVCLDVDVVVFDSDLRQADACSIIKLVNTELTILVSSIVVDP